MSQAQRIYPLQKGGAAQELQEMSGNIVLQDLTAQERFGFKGPGSSAFVAAQGLTAPDINAHSESPWLLRLGREEYAFLASVAEDKQVAELRSQWQVYDGAKGYNAWRDEGWAWIHLSGPKVFELMAKICPIDVREAALPKGRLAQTRVGYIEAIVLRRDRGDQPGFDVLFDIAAQAFFMRAVEVAAAEFQLGESQ